MPYADSNPQFGGMMIAEVPRFRAKSQACKPPAPPKDTIAKSRRSNPLSIEITRIALSILAFATSIIPSATRMGVSLA